MTPLRIGNITVNGSDSKLYELIDPTLPSFEEQFSQISKQTYHHYYQVYYVYSGYDYYVKIDSKKDIRVKNNSGKTITFVKCDEFSTATYNVYRFTMPDISASFFGEGITITIKY